MLARAETNLTVLFNQRVVAAEMADARTIKGVQAMDTLTGELTAHQGRYYVDCTGDGWLGYYAGAVYRHGREGREEFNESHAPEKADRITMSGCIMGQLALSLRAENAGQASPYTPPAWAPKFPNLENSKRSRMHAGGQWWLEHEGTIDTIVDAEKSRDELIRISFGYWDFVKNHWSERAKVKNHALTYIPHVEAKRESRRLIGDHILTQNEVQTAYLFPDRIAHGGWPLDVHHPQGIYSGAEGPFHCDDRLPLYSIPFRCLYSTNIQNLLFAGRNVSVSHIALGTVRVQGTLSTLGQAAGTAAALCAQGNLTPRELGQKQIGVLQQRLLKDDQYIPELRNEDGADLARGAKVTASSTASHQYWNAASVRLATIRDTQSHELTTTRAMMLPRGDVAEIKSVSLLLRSSLAKPVELELHLREADKSLDFSATNDLATAKATVKPGQKLAYVAFPVKATLQKAFLWVWLPPMKGVEWALMAEAPLESGRAFSGSNTRPWQAHGGQFYAVHTDPPVAIRTGHRPENVVDGVSRIVGTQSHEWVSDPSQGLPQWLELDFGKATRMNSVRLTFDTDMNEKWHTQKLPPKCAKDYTLSALVNGQWMELERVTGNFQRRRIHQFAPVAVEKLKLTVNATQGDHSARVFEVRAYDEPVAAKR